MANVVEVRFREVGKIYSFAPGETEYKRGDHVIVETSRGTEYGTVVLGNHEKDISALPEPLKEIVRKATPEDDRKVAENREKEAEAFRVCKQKIAERNMEMKLIDAEYAFDGSKILFYFTADGRVDFRDLVRDLASVFRNRIELRQVGVRDETKIVGGMGSCGRALCCHSYLTDFVPVSIRMAKEQNLSLNPQKISGVCGRLMCCLKNEADTYAYLNKNLPKKGDTVELTDGLQGEVTELNILRQKVKVLVFLDNDEREFREIPAEELTVIGHKKKGQPGVPKKGPTAERELPRRSFAEKTEKKDDREKPKRDRRKRLSDISEMTDMPELGTPETAEEEAARKAAAPERSQKPQKERKQGQERKPQERKERPQGQKPQAQKEKPQGQKPQTQNDRPRPQNPEQEKPEDAEKAKRRRSRHRGHRNPNAAPNQTAGTPSGTENQDRNRKPGGTAKPAVSPDRKPAAPENNGD